ncbi:hypothetical protein FJT64_011674 [Amphibalanus amphitrite]|uniref:Uncharacterized protein n=1 Tax=Amphibalanus amphitrite TaxID=1232801 RepID=A0A6A4VI32_AMPAM|nr:hypothetical protein FJT64_011674 [Amphibalanus amphitrite]
MGFAKENLLRIPTMVKIGQIVLLFITIGIAQGGHSHPGFGGAVNAYINDASIGDQAVHCIEDKHSYFFGAGICMCYLLNCCVLVICYLLGDTKTQFSKFELGMSVIGSALFLALAIKLFVSSSGDSTAGGQDDTAKLITEGCCCVGVAVLQIVDAIFIHIRIKDNPTD